MKFISWNVNGLRACMKKGFPEFFQSAGADIFALQETKMSPDQADIAFPSYTSYWNSAEKKGYSGTAVFTRLEPIAVTYDFGVEEHSREGRVITLEFEDFFFVNVYTPNSQNVAHREIDLKNPKTNVNNAGFTPQERDKLTSLLESGFVDSFRLLYPDREGAYSWWSYRFNARANNAGWRIDYFIVSRRIKDSIHDSRILPEITGSDNCPVELDIF